jgi:hypothetical protein
LYSLLVSLSYQGYSPSPSFISQFDTSWCEIFDSQNHWWSIIGHPSKDSEIGNSNDSLGGIFYIMN